MRRVFLLAAPLVAAAVAWHAAGRAPVSPEPLSSPTEASVGAVGEAAARQPNAARTPNAAGAPKVSAAPFTTPPSPAPTHDATSARSTDRADDPVDVVAATRDGQRLPAAADAEPAADALAAAIGDPANSDLPADVFTAAAATAAEVVRADTTGAGRDAFPDYWTGHAGVCCARVSVHAAGAHPHPFHPDLIAGVVLWSARTHQGVAVGGLATIPLTGDGHGGWRPTRQAPP